MLDRRQLLTGAASLVGALLVVAPAQAQRRKREKYWQEFFDRNGKLILRVEDVEFVDAERNITDITGTLICHDADIHSVYLFFHGFDRKQEVRLKEAPVFVGNIKPGQKIRFHGFATCKERPRFWSLEKVTVARYSDAPKKSREPEPPPVKKGDEQQGDKKKADEQKDDEKKHDKQKDD